MNKVVFVRLYAYFVISATEHRKRDQKHSKGKGKVTPIKEILCVVYYNFYSHLVLWDNTANNSWVLSFQAVSLQDQLWIGTCKYITNKTECMLVNVMNQ